MVKSRHLSTSRIQKLFGKLPDPRRRPTRAVYPLVSLIVIALCATVSGANTSQDIALFARTHRDWLATVVDLPEDSSLSPSHDTFDRLLSALDPIAFQKCLVAWLKALHDYIPGLIAIDGKVAREAMARAKDQGPLTLVSAWSTENRLCLGQVAGESGSNELQAIPRLLELLCLQDAVVTADALSCQHNIVEQIVKQGGDYVISVKGNQPTLEKAVHETIAKALEEGTAVKTRITADNRRGRDETRCYVAVPAPIDDPVFQNWKSVKSIVSVTREYTDAKGVRQIGARYFISSLKPKVNQLSEAVRGHWGIENGLHWILDVSFGEDLNRSRRADAQANFGVLRRVAISLLKNAPELKGSIDSRRKQAGWDEKSLENAIFGRELG